MKLTTYAWLKTADRLSYFSKQLYGNLGDEMYRLAESIDSRVRKSKLNEDVELTFTDRQVQLLDVLNRLQSLRTD